MPRGITTTPSSRDQKPASDSYIPHKPGPWVPRIFLQQGGYQTFTAITEKRPYSRFLLPSDFVVNRKRIYKVLGYHALAHRLLSNAGHHYYATGYSALYPIHSWVRLPPRSA